MANRSRTIASFFLLAASVVSAAPPKATTLPPAPIPRPSGPISEPDYPGLAQLTMVLTTDPVEQHRVAAVEQMTRIPAEMRHLSALLNLAANRDPSLVVRHAAKQALTLVQTEAANFERLNAESKAHGVGDRTAQTSRLYRDALVAVSKTNGDVQVASATEMPNLDFFPSTSPKPAPIAPAAKWSLPEPAKLVGSGEPKPVGATFASPMPKRVVKGLPPIPTSLEPMAPLVLSPEGK